MNTAFSNGFMASINVKEATGYAGGLDCQVHSSKQ
jgi:hypothetical protein